MGRRLKALIKRPSGHKVWENTELWERGGWGVRCYGSFQEEFGKTVDNAGDWVGRPAARVAQPNLRASLSKQLAFFKLLCYSWSCWLMSCSEKVY